MHQFSKSISRKEPFIRIKKGKKTKKHMHCDYQGITCTHEKHGVFTYRDLCNILVIILDDIIVIYL